MSNWYVVKPEYTKNLVTNPSFETGTSGWTAGAGSLAQSTDHQRRGLYSGKYTPSSGTTDGAHFGLSLATGNSYTFSVDVWVADGIPYQIYAYDVTAGAVLGSATTFTGRGAWTRRSVTFSTGANTSIRLYVAKNGSASTAAFYIDGAQCEAKAYATTYCDGDRDGCTWTAGAHGSASERSGQYYGGGRVVDLANLDGNGRGFLVRQMLDVGMPPMQQTATKPALGGGGNFQRTYADIRVFQLVGSFLARNFKNTAQQRNPVIDLIKPDRLANSQPIQLRFAGYDKPLAIDCYYDDGMRIGERTGFLEHPALQFIAYDPDFRTVVGTGGADSSDNGSTSGVDSGGDTAIEGSAEESIADANYIIQRDNAGQWAALGSGLSMPSPTGLSATVNALAIGVDGKIYAGDRGSGADIHEWDGTGWTSIGTAAGTLTPFGVTSIEAIVVDANGDLYVGGSFTSIDAVSASGLAKYTKSTDTWSAIGTGANQTVLALAMDSTGLLYIGGYFTAIDGTGAFRVASYDPDTTTVSDLDTGANAAVTCVAVDANDDLYAGGLFTSIGTTPAISDRFARWDGAAWNDISANFNNSVKDVFVAFDGTVYVAGNFTTGGASQTFNYIAAYDPTGATWSALGSGLNNSGYSVVSLADSVFVGGNFTVAGGVDVNYSAAYSLSTGVWSAVGDGVDDYVNALLAGPDGKLYAAGNFTGTVAIWTGADWQGLVPFTQAIVQAADGSIYVGGGFINAGGVAAGDKIAKWSPDSGAWSALGTGANGTVYAIAEAPNGDIYIGGSFSQVGGVSDTAGIAYWDGSAWNALSTGIDGTVLALAFAPNGHLYIGGLFTNAGGIGSTQNLAVWTGFDFATIGFMPNSTVNTLAVDMAGNLILGGAFTQLGGVAAAYIGQWDGSAFSALASGVNGYVNDLVILPSNDVVLAGAFTTAGGVTVNHIARWNGARFLPLKNGLNNVAYCLALDSESNIYIGGVFTTADGVTLPDKAAVWNGSSFASLPVDLPGNAAVEALLITPGQQVYIGFDTTGTATAGATN